MDKSQSALVNSVFWKITPKINQSKYKLPSNKAILFLKECIYFSALQYELFFKLFPRYLRPNDKVLEIGSGPGENLVLINKITHSSVYGIENSPTRFVENTKYFAKNNIPLRNLFKEDFLKFKTSKKFDVVFSNGFIEHYKDPEKVVAKQTEILKKGGILICIIPNFSGINRLIQMKLNGKILKMHNMDIMNLKKFNALFLDFEKIYCGYMGIFSTRIFSSNNKLLNIIFYILKPFRVISNIIFLLFSSILSTKLISTGPILVFVGRKK